MREIRLSWFGGRGDRSQSVFPTPITRRTVVPNRCVWRSYPPSSSPAISFLPTMLPLVEIMRGAK